MIRETRSHNEHVARLLSDIGPWTRLTAKRPGFKLPGLTDADVRLFTVNEWHQALAGWWELLPVRWMNQPSRDDVASRKALQLRVAAEVGLRVPRTLITSDPDVARAFLDGQGIGRTIYKTFSCTHAIWRETRLVRAEDLALLDTLRPAPVISRNTLKRPPTCASPSWATGCSPPRSTRGARTTRWISG